MEPTLSEGDLLLVLWGARVDGALSRRAQIRVVRLPPDDAGLARPLAVKRVTGEDPDSPTRWWIDSDNPREGVTSFDVGSLAGTDVVAAVLARLWPRPRRLVPSAPPSPAPGQQM